MASKAWTATSYKDNKNNSLLILIDTVILIIVYEKLWIYDILKSQIFLEYYLWKFIFFHEKNHWVLFKNT